MRCARGALLALLTWGCASAGAVKPEARIATATTALDSLRAAIDSMVAAPEFRNAHWGILIMDPDSARTLYAHNAEKLFMPASNMKIITGASALTLLGPDFRFRTTLVARGRVVNGTLQGDLVVHGRGDPTVSDSMRVSALDPLRALADSLLARGVHRIAGRLLPGDDVFPGPVYGDGWAWDDLAEPYAAGVDELFFNEGFGTVRVRGGAAAGAPVTVSTAPAHSYPVLRVSAVTGRAEATTGPSSPLQIALDTAASMIAVTGRISVGAEVHQDVVYPNQRAAYLLALRDALSERGITVAGGSVPATALTVADTMAVLRSPPLRDVLRRMEKPSQNQIAEILLRTIGLERTGVGTADSGRLVEAQLLRSWGADSGGFVITDGSGLSRYNYLTPTTIVRTLTAVRRDTAFHVFYDALPVAGVDGTIGDRMRGTPAAGNVHAKTGFIANARSLSGYVTTADHHLLVFSALCNNWTATRAAVESVQDAIASRLATLTLYRAP